jgi:hypothetical protein
MADDRLAERLTHMLAVLNLSRGALAAAIGVDKSVVGRWTRGLMRPSEHNLSLITAFVAGRRPGFDMTHWEAADAVFTAALAPPAAVAAPVDWLPVSARHSALEVAREGDGYTGIYVQIRRRFIAPGDMFAELVVIWRDADTLRFGNAGAFWNHQGRGFILHHQLYFIYEDAGVSDGIVMTVLNGVPGGAALATDGVMTAVQGDRLRAPASAPVLLLRLADLDAPMAAPDAARLTALQMRIADLVDAGSVATLSGPEIVAHITPLYGVEADDGETDHLLRVPATRGFSGTERNASPVLRAAVSRWRQAVLGAASVSSPAETGLQPSGQTRLSAP